MSRFGVVGPDLRFETLHQQGKDRIRATCGRLKASSLLPLLLSRGSSRLKKKFVDL